MKKRILSSLALAALIGTASAQIFSEDFDAGIPSSFTLTDADGLTPNSNVGALSDAWNASSATDDNGVAKDAALSTSWFSPAGQADDWMSTPAIAIPTTSNTVVLEWSSMTLDGSYPDGLQVYISTTGTSPSDFSSTAVYSSNSEPTVWTDNQVDISSYNGQTIYVAFRNNSTDMFVLAVDDIVIRELMPVDAKLLSLNITPYGTGGNVNIEGTVENNGSSTISSFDISYSINGGAAVSETFTQTIPSGQSYNFTHGTPLAAVAGNLYVIDVNVTVASDGDATNNDVTTGHTALTTAASKTVVGEEKTGSWCGWCPRGAVGLAGMESTSNFIGIAVHNSDPMTVTPYDANIGTYIPGGYPGGGVDRVIEGDPGSFSTMHSQRASAIVPCEVNNISAIYDATNSQIEVSADAEFLEDVYGSFRLSCVILEDDVMGTGSGWSQANYYDGGGSGTLTDPNTGFEWSTAGDPVAPSAFGGYDHVARSLSYNSILGDPGSIPSSSGIVAKGTHSYKFGNLPSSTVDDYTKSHAVVMIVDSKTGEILNASKGALVAGAVSTGELANAKFNFNVYPNPSFGLTNVTLNLDESSYVTINIYNTLGEMVYNNQKGQLAEGNHNLSLDLKDLNAGMYFVNIAAGEKSLNKSIILK